MKLLTNKDIRKAVQQAFLTTEFPVRQGSEVVMVKPNPVLGGILQFANAIGDALFTILKTGPGDTVQIGEALPVVKTVFGNTIWSGGSVPLLEVGQVGDFYINTALWTIYGPKTIHGWGAPVALVGDNDRPVLAEAKAFVASH